MTPVTLPFCFIVPALVENAYQCTHDISLFALLSGNGKHLIHAYQIAISVHRHEH